MIFDGGIVRAPAVLAGLACLALLAVSCSDNTTTVGPGSGVEPPAGQVFRIGDAGGRLLSADGALIVEVPPGATGVQELVVSPVDRSRLAADFEPFDLIGAWELGPDGTVFSEDVTFEVDLTRLQGVPRGAGLPLLWVSEGDGYELAEGQEVFDGGPGEAFVLRGRAAHFSTIAATFCGQVQLLFTSDDVARVGDKVQASGTLEASEASTVEAWWVEQRANSGGALEEVRQGRAFGTLTTGASTTTGDYDEVACDEAGRGQFEVEALLEVASVVRNGRRTIPRNWKINGVKPVFCYDGSGHGSSGGGVSGDPNESLLVSPTHVERRVGGTFTFKIQVSGRTGPQIWTLEDVFPGIVSQPRLWTGMSWDTGAATDPAVRPGRGGLSEVTLTLGGTGAVHIEYTCEEKGDTGIVVHVGQMRATVLVNCRQAADEGSEPDHGGLEDPPDDDGEPLPPDDGGEPLPSDDGG